MRFGDQKSNSWVNYNLLIGSLLVWTLGLIFQRVILKYNPLLPSHDAKFYFYSSERWDQMLEPFHVPLYPLLLRLVRWLSLDSFSPLFYTQGLNLLLFLLSIQCFYYLAKRMDLKHEGANRMSWIFALFLFTGFSYALTPIADQLSILLLLVFLISLMSRRWWQTIVTASLCVMAHKIAWPIIAIAFIAIIWTEKENRAKWIAGAIIASLPLAFYWYYGALHHNEPMWLLRANLNKEMQSEGAWYPFIGFVNLFVSATLINWIKLLSILVILTGAGVRLGRLNSPDNHLLLGLPVLLSLLLFSIVLNDFEMFVILRYGKLLLICVLGWLRPDWLIKPFWWLLFSILFLSNLFFMWHAAGSPEIF